MFMCHELDFQGGISDKLYYDIKESSKHIVVAKDEDSANKRYVELYGHIVKLQMNEFSLNLNKEQKDKIDLFGGMFEIAENKLVAQEIDYIKLDYLREQVPAKDYLMYVKSNLSGMDFTEFVLKI